MNRILLTVLLSLTLLPRLGLGAMPPAELNRIFFLQLQVIGSTMGTRDELGELISFLHLSGLRPRIDRTLPLEQVAEGLTAMQDGNLVGKIVIVP